jgi:hypothetical protein
MRIAFAVPIYDNPEGMFFQSFTTAVAHLYQSKIIGPDGEPLEFVTDTFVCSGIIQEARHRLFFEALKWEADYIIWCDSDHIFPKDAFVRLLAHNKLIVGCNYARRTHQGQPTAPTAAKLNRDEQDEKLCYTTEEKVKAEELEKVDHLGLGLTCINMSVLELLTDQAEKEGKSSFMPLFAWPEKEAGAGTGSVGEDVHFFQKCRDAGIDIWCDHALSWEVGHIVKRVLTHAHVANDKQRWIKEET